MNKEFVKYEQSLALKELGFDEPCIGWYNPQVNYKKVTTDKYWAFHLTGEWENFKPAPLYQQAFRFFREKHKLEPEIMSDMMGYVASIVDRNVPLKIRLKPSNLFQTYEEAEQACLDKLIEIIKSK
jgi:hypothetical protein